MSMEQEERNRFHTYSDYLAWSGEERWEIVGGVAHSMFPAPGRAHQTVSRRMAFQIEAFLENGPCEMFTAPFDVRLSESPQRDDAVMNVVQPDILVVCDPQKLDERGCKGAPDWVIEITSPATASRDHILKRDLYERYGVKEYWIVQPLDRVVMVYRLDSDGRYARPEVHAEEHHVPVAVLDGLVMELKRIFVGVKA